jgi:hypothetical protein
MVFVPFLASAEGATIWTDKDNYGPSETVTIFGSGFLPSTEVTITLVAPDLSVATIYAWTDEFGAFTAQHLLDGMEGTYTVTATDGTNTATTTFTEAVQIKTYMDAAYATEETVFLPGATVYAKATGLAKAKWHEIEWFDPSSASVQATVYGPPDGSTTERTDSYVLSSSATIGAWTVEAFEGTSATGPWTKKKEATFYVWHHIAPTADSWVESSNPTKNYGSDNDLHVKVEWDSKKSEVTNLRRAYLKFDLSGLPSGAIIDSAILHLYRTTADSNIPSAYQTTDAWTEMTITWNTQTGFLFTFVADGTMGSAWFKWNITSYAASEFAGDKILSVVLKFKTESGSDQHADFTSREGTWNQRPWLEISYSMPPPTVDITVTSSPLGDHFVKVDDGEITTPHTFTWTIGSKHKLEALSPVAGLIDTQYVWTNWSDSGAQTHNYTVPNSNAIVTANYKTQYKITVTSTVLDPTFNVTYTKCGTVYNQVGQTTTWSDWADAGTTVTASNPQDIINDGPGTRYKFKEYDPSASVTMTDAKIITLVYKTQYKLTVVSLYDTPGGEDWYDKCTYANATLATGTVNITLGWVRAVFTNWTGDASGTGLTSTIHMDGPKTAVANWKIQYYLDVVKDPAIPPPIPGANWYDKCTWVELTAPQYIPSEAGSGGVRYKFSMWDVDETPQIGNPIDVHMDAPHIATAHYTPQCYLTVRTDPPGIANITGEGWYYNCTWVTLKAPLEPNATYLFAYWKVDGTTYLENSIQVHMNCTPKTATAVYKDYLGDAKEEIKALRAKLDALLAAKQIGKREYDYFMHALNAIQKDITRGMKQLDRERRGFNDRQKGFEDLRHAVMKINRLIRQVQNWVRKGKIPPANATEIINELETIRMKLVNKCWAEALAERALALKAIAEANALGKDTTKAWKEIDKVNRELAKAIEAIAKGKYSQAIQHFKHAFNHSQHAVKKAYDRSWDTDYKDWIDELEEEDP